MSTFKPTRQIPSTPRRPLSSSASAEDVGRLPRSTIATPLLATSKKYTAAISTESRTRTTSRPRPISTVPSTPLRKGNDASRPKTPNTPRSARDTDSPLLRPLSAMDVRNVDPEEALVDFQTLDPGDLSLDIDEALLSVSEHGSKDKVLVSIRMRPSDLDSAWDATFHGDKSLKLQTQHSKSSGTPVPVFHFDEILTGSENKPVYNAVARSHVAAAMDGYNAVVFAYGQTASGKTFTLSGDEDEPGIIPRAMKDIFGFIRRTPTREYLLRCSYLEIYNEAIHDLLAPPSAAAAQPVQLQGTGNNVFLSPLREEVVTSLKEMKEVIARGEGNRRTATTDWNERSSRSHSVFRVVIESRERGDGTGASASGRHTPGFRPPTPGGPRLQAIGERSVQTSVLSLIDLAGSEKATSDKERTREGKYINTSLLTLGSVISTLADNAAKNKNDHVPFRNSKLTRMLQPSLSGDARISVICTINPDAGAVAETTSTLLFAQRVKKVALNARKKEVVDADALIERYRKEIEDLKSRLAERETDAPVRNRRLSARQQIDETNAMKDLNSRIQQLSKLILTSQTVDESQGDKSRPSSPVKVDFDMSPYQLQQELLAARRELETSRTQILSLEATLLARPPLPPDAPESEKDKLIADQARTIRELEIVVQGYEENLGEPLRAVREDVEREWFTKVEKEARAKEEKEAWAEVLVQQLEKEKRVRITLENERQALAAFVSKFDSLGLGGLAGLAATPPSKLRAPMPSAGGASKVFAERQRNRIPALALPSIEDTGESPARLDGADRFMGQGSLLLEQTLDEDWAAADDVSFDLENPVPRAAGLKLADGAAAAADAAAAARGVLGAKENLPTS